MLTEKLFLELITAASLAASADNMQPWEFRQCGDTIEVFLAPQRLLPCDVHDIFAWVSIGAALQNLVVAAAAHGLAAHINYSPPEQAIERAASVSFTPCNPDGHLADWIALRSTNRCPYQSAPLPQPLISALTNGIKDLNAGLHWSTTAADFDQMAAMDARLSYIRLDHPPLHDELFEILRFTRQETERIRYGLEFKSLEVPAIAVFFARPLKHWSVYRLVKRLRISRIIAKQLSSRLRQTGALCLITAHQPTPAGYMEAGRAMEQLWLTATAKKLSIQPYGVLPQYLTKAAIEPETFTPDYRAMIEHHRAPFFSIFPRAKDEYPAIVLRVGYAESQSPRSNVRLKPDQIIRK